MQWKELRNKVKLGRRGGRFKRGWVSVWDTFPSQSHSGLSSDPVLLSTSTQNHPFWRKGPSCSTPVGWTSRSFADSFIWPSFVELHLLSRSCFINMGKTPALPSRRLMIHKPLDLLSYRLPCLTESFNHFEKRDNVTSSFCLLQHLIQRSSKAPWNEGMSVNTQRSRSPQCLSWKMKLARVDSTPLT